MSTSLALQTTIVSPFAVLGRWITAGRRRRAVALLDQRRLRDAGLIRCGAPVPRQGWWG
jgi:uncharacterized protein YjiS (DUF1127 family)